MYGWSAPTLHSGRIFTSHLPDRFHSRVLHTVEGLLYGLRIGVVQMERLPHLFKAHEPQRVACLL